MNSNTATIAAVTPALETSTPANAEAGAVETPVPVIPTTPEQLRDVKLAQLLEQRPSFETLKALGLAKLTELAKENSDAQTRVKNSADKFKKTAKGVGKVLAAMKVAYADAQNANVLGRGTSFEDYHKSVVGEKPWNHAMQCAVVFCELVLTNRLSETDYDRRAADWLQTSSVIINAIKKAGFDLNCPEIAELVTILQNAPDDEGAKQLRQLRNKVKGTEKAEPGDPEVLNITDFRNADVLIRRACQTTYEVNGVKVHGLVLVARIVTDYVKSEKSDGVLSAVYTALNASLDLIPEEKQTAFLKASGVLPELKKDAPAAAQAA